MPPGTSPYTDGEVAALVDMNMPHVAALGVGLADGQAVVERVYGFEADIAHEHGDFPIGYKAHFDYGRSPPYNNIKRPSTCANLIQVWWTVRETSAANR